MAKKLNVSIIALVIVLIWFFGSLGIQAYCYYEGLSQSDFCHELSSDRLIGIFIFPLIVWILGIQIISGKAFVSRSHGGGEVGKQEFPLIYWTWMLIQMTGGLYVTYYFLTR